MILGEQLIALDALLDRQRVALRTHATATNAAPFHVSPESECRCGSRRPGSLAGKGVVASSLHTGLSRVPGRETV